MSIRFCDINKHTYTARILSEPLESKIEETRVFYARTETSAKGPSVSEFDEITNDIIKLILNQPLVSRSVLPSPYNPYQPNERNQK